MSGGARPLLCIETATPAARVAVVDVDGRALATGEAVAERHSANVLRLCDEVLGRAGLVAAGLGGIACGGGPGSFTGLRVGLSVAKGLALATGAPLILVPSLAALALDMLDAAEGDAIAVPCIDAGKGEVYAALYRRDRDALVRADRDAGAGAGAEAGGDAGAVADLWRLPPAELAARLVALRAAGDAAPVVLAGNGAERFAAVLDAAARRLTVPGPTALSVGRLALLRHRRGESDDLAAAVPLYGRPPDITVSKKLPPSQK